jgi:hypothetical protein
LGRFYREWEEGALIWLLSSSPKAILKYRDLALVALEARAAKEAAAA